MFALRCTSKLLTRIGTPAPSAPPPTTLLGDWYANVLFSRRGQFILSVSERTLLPLVLPARDARSLPRRLPDALRAVLVPLGISMGAIDRELSEMREVTVARTANRTLLGSMNDLAFGARLHLDAGIEPLAVAARLIETPCGPLAMSSPLEATMELFASVIH